MRSTTELYKTWVSDSKPSTSRRLPPGLIGSETQSGHDAQVGGYKHATFTLRVSLPSHQQDIYESGSTCTAEGHMSWCTGTSAVRGTGPSGAQVLTVTVRTGDTPGETLPFNPHRAGRRDPPSSPRGHPGPSGPATNPTGSVKSRCDHLNGM